ALIQACRHCCKISQAIWVGDCSFIHGTGEHSKHHKVQGSRVKVQGSRVKGQGSSNKSKALWGKTPSYHKLNSCHTHSPIISARSEERRVGKECRSRWSA